MDVIRKVLHQHLGDIKRRGHMPNCQGGWPTTQGPRPCTALCQAAQRVLEQGSVEQGVLV